MCFSNSRLKVFAQPILSQRYFSPLCVASCSFSQDTAALPPPPVGTLFLYQQSTEAKTATTRKAFYSCILFWSAYANHYKNPIYRRPAG